MALTDLIINHSQVTEELIETILKGRINLIETNRQVQLSKSSFDYSTKVRILLYLCGKHAWALMGNTDKQPSSIQETEKETGVVGSTLRVSLGVLKGEHLIDSEQSKYFITNLGIRELEKMLTEEDAKEDQGPRLARAKAGRGSSGPKGRPEVLETIKQKPLDGDYVTSVMPILSKEKTSNQYLLALHIASTKFDLAGLTPSEVNYVLTEPPIALPATFHVSNISRDLGKLRGFVTPYKVGKSYEYRLNTPGKEHVATLLKKSD